MRVNMDSSIAADPRFKLAGRELGLDWKAVVGSCFLVYLAAYERRSKCFRKIEADIAAEVDGFADALVSVGLATEIDDDTVEIHGVEARIKFLDAQREKGSKGGKQSGKSRVKKPEANASAPAKQMLPKNEASGFGSAQAYPLAPDQSPDQSLSPDPRAPSADTQPGSAVPVVAQLWSELNRYQSELGLRVTPMSINSETLVHRAIKDFSADEVAHTLRVLFRKAKADPAQAKWLDGAKTWSTNVIEFNRGEPAAAPKPKPNRPPVSTGDSPKPSAEERKAIADEMRRLDPFGNGRRSA